MSNQPHESEHLLPTTHPAASRPSQSDDETLAEGVDGSLDLDQTERDHKFLDEEEERDNLLAGKKRTGRLQQLFNGSESDQHAPKKHKKPKRKSRRSRQRGPNDEVSELMYEMEEGGEPSNSDDSSRGSSESDENRLRVVQGQKAVSSFEQRLCTPI
jgi:hypothetical protein